jgi:hypothetical protein
MVGIALVGFLGFAWSGLSDLFNSKYFLSSLFFTSIAGVFAAIGHWVDFEGHKELQHTSGHFVVRNYFQ